MNLKQYCAGILLGGLLGLTGLPSWAQDVTGQLNQALCSEDWDGAIALVDNMMSAYPNNRTQLQQYRDRLQQLQASPTGLSAAQKAQYCSQAQQTPTPTPTSSNLKARIEQYYAQMDEMSYEQVVALLGSAGQVRDRYSAYTWEQADGAVLFAEFPKNQLNSLMTSPGMSCSESNTGFQCDSLPLPTAFERIETGMSEQVVLQQLGEPTERHSIVGYEWQFQEGDNTCTLGVSFRDNVVSAKLLSCSN
ncbi:MAG: hypothetical protein SAJ12_14030 [Jaaginema sp. PMC 1079.18]|nr:hypothetical protein [Jaaginema sp. PMC 1080.18]MEC4852101.1 hypothetical protein [Jaaginema sp. PMC 1079.18]MEC4868694.1 hypothetical protein [Jaaginema sp. PMC 1078.18]